jgi:hypothetical protein
MRTLLATLIALGSIYALTSPADAGRKYKRAPGSYYYAPYDAPPGYSYAPPPAALRERQICEERAQAEDPSGLYAGYPCWARETFGRGSSGGRGR